MSSTSVATTHRWSWSRATARSAMTRTSPAAVTKLRYCHRDLARLSSRGARGRGKVVGSILTGGATEPHGQTSGPGDRGSPNSPGNEAIAEFTPGHVSVNEITVATVRDLERHTAFRGAERDHGSEGLPDTGTWTAHAARNLFLRHADQLAGSPFVEVFDEIFRTEGVKILPPQRLQGSRKVRPTRLPCHQVNAGSRLDRRVPKCRLTRHDTIFGPHMDAQPGSSRGIGGRLRRSPTLKVRRMVVAERNERPSRPSTANHYSEAGQEAATRPMGHNSLEIHYHPPSSSPLLSPVLRPRLHRRRPPEVRLVGREAFLEAAADRIEHLDAGPPLVVGGDQIPGGTCRARLRDHVVHRALVERPLLAVAVVVVRELVLLVGRIGASLEATQLLLLAEM